MTTTAVRPAGGLRRLLGMIVETYCLAPRSFVAAPALVALAVVPEAAQHVAEIRLGMFETAAAFRALAADPTRWAFGYAKVTGLVLAMLTLARFWASGSVRAALLPPPRDLLRIVLAVGLSVLLALPFEWLQARAAPPAALTIGIVSAVVQAGLLVWVAAALVGERTVTLRSAFGRDFPTAVTMTLVAAAGFVPAQALHMVLHRLALGRPDAVVWALMTLDSLVVGLLAALVGAALAVAVRQRLTWRGWAG